MMTRYYPRKYFPRTPYPSRSKRLDYPNGSQVESDGICSRFEGIRWNQWGETPKRMLLTHKRKIFCYFNPKVKGSALSGEDQEGSVVGSSLVKGWAQAGRPPGQK